MKLTIRKVYSYSDSGAFQRSSSLYSKETPQGKLLLYFKKIILYLLFFCTSYHLTAQVNLQNGLVAYYPFHNNTNDVSGNANHGTLAGAVSTTDRFGNANSAYQFNGSNENGTRTYIIGDCSGFPTLERTTSFWFYSEAIGIPEQGMGFLGYGGQSCGQSWLQMIDIPLPGRANTYELTSHCDNQLDNYSYGETHPNHNWHHWVVTTIDTVTKFYIDGLLVKTSSTIHQTTVAGKVFTFGGIPSNDGSSLYEQYYAFDGKLDDIGIWNRALNASEVSALYQGCNLSTPFLLHENDITGNTATLKWTAIDALSYELQYRIATTATWKKLSITDKSAIIGGLSPSTLYEWRVRGKCGDITFSKYSPIKTFTTGDTPITCDTPTGLIITGLTDNHASLAWDAVSNALNYDFRYRVNASATWTTLNVNNNGIDLSGLFSGTTYQYQVRSRCSSNNSFMSSYSAMQNFTTLGASPCEKPSLIINSLQTNAVTLGWASVSGAAAYEISLKPSASSSYPANIVVNDTIYTFNALSPNTTYTVRIRTVCTLPLRSEYAYKTFTTLAVAPMASLALSPSTTVVDDSQWYVYPNPSKGEFTVRLSSNRAKGLQQLQVRNMHGQQVWHNNAVDGTTINKLDLCHLPKGVYYLRLTHATGTELKRLIIE
jgi:hypothetical protein